MSVALVFPGQGAQKVGMMAELLAASALMRERLAEASDLVELDLAKLVAEGPEAELNATAQAQPVLFTLCGALFEECAARYPELAAEVAFCAGHSLGEYTALFAAGVIDFATGVKLTRERGLLMGSASVPGGMRAVIGLDADEIAPLCKAASTEGEYCSPANINAPGQVVISGAEAALDRAAELLKAAGAKRVLPLAVSGPFHSAYMAPVAARMEQLLKGVSLSPARWPVVANVTGQPVASPEEVGLELVAQLTNGVEWVKSVQFMVDRGVHQFVELGAKDLLGGMIKRINSEANTLSVWDTGSLEALGGGSL